MPLEPIAGTVTSAVICTVNWTLDHFNCNVNAGQKDVPKQDQKKLCNLKKKLQGHQPEDEIV